MDKKKLDSEFASQLTRVSQSVVLLGGHSRFLLMSPDRHVRIENVVKQAQALLVLSDAYDKGLTAEKEATALQILTSQQQSEDNDTIDGEQEPGFTMEHLALDFVLDDIGEALSVDGKELDLIYNPHGQRITLKSSDETVLAIEDGQYLVKGAGKTTLSATLYKAGDIPGYKSEMELELTLKEPDTNGTETESAPEDGAPIGFLRPEPDYDLDLELGKDAFIGTVLGLPVGIANPNNEEFEFESSDTNVFEVDPQSGAMLPKAAGDAALHLHIGDVTDVLVVSIK
ncbi:hypothetical protein [Vibrio campbellii]|uniref:hypothetical protein n=1 Tax=Vibrio campbellii TaxID=680 RepID=UPI001F453E76|nr:hypothetical protein [Vibrio campbellii]MCE7729621.1 hypothetical protein [Vibrio campbellii]